MSCREPLTRSDVVDATHTPPSDASAPATAIVGTPTTLGGYRIERLLGEGGMGAVYLARDDRLERSVAIKTLKPQVAVQPGAVERFLREARAIARVAHDNIIPILHIGEDAGMPYIVMPVLQGEPLDKFLHREPLPALGAVLKVGRETADGLAAAHARGLVHRDIKPANLWIEGDPTSADLAKQFRRVKILDFGLARPATEDTQLTSAGAIIGTPAYMSPEQARGTSVDFRTDLFSLGVVLYRMTTGNLPFSGHTTMAILTSLAIEHPTPPIETRPDIPVALSDLIMRLLEKDREKRPKSAAEVAATLRAIGKELVAAQKAASGTLPIVVYPQPITQSPAQQFNPWTEIDATALTSDAEKTDPTITANTNPDRTEKTKPRHRGAGLWIAAGLVSLFAVAAVTVAVIKLRGPKDKEPPVISGEKAKNEGKPTPRPSSMQPARTDPDGKAAEWVFDCGGKVYFCVSTRQPPAPLLGGLPEGWTLPPDVREATATRDLPVGKFRVVAIRLPKCERVTADGLACLVGLTDLVWLDLFETQVTEAGLAHVGMLKNLRWLGLQRTGVKKDWLTPLRNLSELRELRLGDTGLENEALEHVAGLAHLEVLRLNGTAISDDGLVHLKGLGNLRVLDLIKTNVEGPGFQHLESLNELTTLDLTATKLKDAEIGQLAGLKHLTSLNLSETDVTAMGVQNLQGKLPACTITPKP